MDQGDVAFPLTDEASNVVGAHVRYRPGKPALKYVRAASSSGRAHPLHPHSPKTGHGLTQQEVEFIRAVSGLTAKQSQGLATLIFQTFGGSGFGQFVFLHISIGNNQLLASIVQNIMSSFTYHASEKSLTNVFLDYDGPDPTANPLLAHYQDLIKIVTGLHK